MAAMPVPAGGAPLTASELGLALTFFDENAPEQLSVSEPPTPSALVFVARSYTPRGLERERIPAVGEVRFVALRDAKRLDVVASEMRSSAVMTLSPWQPDAEQQLVPLAMRLDYPVRATPADIDADGDTDFIVSGIGGMDPGNQINGRLILLRQEPGAGSGRPGFRSQPIASTMARACDAQLGDVDGDGDLDIIACCFGWRGPGQLRLLTNHTKDATRPEFSTRVLDARDGYVGTRFGDFDGDGILDFIALLSQQHEMLLLYRGRGEGQFEVSLIHQAPHPAWGYCALELADLDGDGDLDIVTANGDTLDDNVLKPYHGLAWFENRGSLQFLRHAIAPVYGCESFAVADVDGDGDLDLVTAAFLPQIEPMRWRAAAIPSLLWIENRSAASEWRRYAIEIGSCYHSSVAVADCDGDGQVEIAVGNYVWLVGDGQPNIRADYVTIFRRQ